MSIQAHCQNGFVVVFNAAADKFSFAKKVVETTLPDDGSMSDALAHNLARTAFGAKEGNSSRVMKLAQQIKESTMQPEVEFDFDEVPPTVEEVSTVMAEAADAANDVAEVEEVAPVAFSFSGWGAPVAKRDFVQRIKDAAVEAGGELESVVAESDIPDSDEAKVVHDRAVTAKDAKNAAMRQAIEQNPGCTTDELVLAAEKIFGDKLYSAVSSKYWMNKLLEEMGLTPVRGGTRAKKEKVAKAVKVPEAIQSYVNASVGGDAVITDISLEDNLFITAIVGDDTCVIALSVASVVFTPR